MLAGTALGDEERDRPAEKWKGAFRKSAICDMVKLNHVKECMLRTDEGKLLEGIYLYRHSRI